MKRLYKIALIFTFLLWISTYVGVCEEMYVLPRKSVTYSEPDVQSLKLHILTQNTLVMTLGLQTDGWVRTNFGWIRSVYLGFEPFKETIRNTDVSSIEVRKRASNFASSAAAGRGLSNENVRDRNRVSFREYDFDTMKWLETNFSYEYPYLVNFWGKEGPCQAMCLPMEDLEIR